VHAGDTQAAAQAIGTSLGISPKNIYGGVKPAGKADVITRLKVTIRYRGIK
jgi:cation transport ATPase